MDIEYFADLLKAGEIVAFPTETVYGLGANAFDENAVKKIFAAKKRPADNPLIVHVSSIERITTVAENLTDVEEKLFQAFSPGPLTVLLKKKKEIPDIVTAGSDLVGVRIPSHPVALQLLMAAGLPIAAPSANISGKPSATHHDHVIEAFGDTVPVIQAGATQYGIESTVVRVDAQEKIIILRQGAITQEDIHHAFPENVVILAGVDDMDLKASPGTRYKHYSPRGSITLVPLHAIDETAAAFKQYVEASTGDKIAILCSDEVAAQLPETVKIIALGHENNLLEIAKNIYAALLQCDKIGTTDIFAQSFPETGIGKTIMERLRRASDS